MSGAYDVSTDEYAGTVYRQIADAMAAVEYAAFLANNEIGKRQADVSAAIDQIGIALRALHDARAQLVSEAAEYSIEMDRMIREHGRLDMAVLAEFVTTHRRR